MQIHYLQLSAVGPFAGTHTIDFEALSAAGIFLLEGPTGAGKSTLIDAIVFGLYGQVAGGSSSNDRIRSGLVDGNTESVVDLVFETGSGIYRVRRTPQYMRAKKRGTGLTPIQASVRLWQLSVADLDAVRAAGPTGLQDLIVGEFKSQRLDEAGLEISRAIGLDRGQFVQTIVLPQGEFANFLKAKPEERRDLLQKVFGTEIYQRAQDELAAMRREVKAQADSATAELDRAKTGFVTAAALDKERAAQLEATGPEELMELVSQILEELVQESGRTANIDSAAQNVAGTAQAVLVSGKAQLRAAERRTALHAEQAALAKQAPGVTQGREDLKVAAKAAIVLPIAQSLNKAMENEQRTVKALESATGAAERVIGAEDLVGDPALRTQKLRSLAVGLSKELGQRRGYLGQVLILEQELPARDKANEKLTKALQRHQTEFEAATVALAERPPRLQDLAAVATRLSGLAQRVPADKHAVDRAQERAKACANAAQTAQELQSAQTQLAAANKAATELITFEAGLRTARISQIAGELGQELETGCPCPVCGALEHPNPAQLGEDAVAVEKIEQAEDQRKKAEAVVATRRSVVVQLTERLSAQDVGELTAEVAHKELTEAQMAAAESELAEAELPAATLAITTFEAETQTLREKIATLKTAISSAEVELDLHNKSVDTDRKRIAQELEVSGTQGVFASVGELSQDLANQEMLLDTLLGALEESAAAQKRVADQIEHLESVLDEQGLESAEVAQEVALTAAHTATITARIRNYEANITRVSTGLVSPEITELPEKVDVDLDELARVAEEESAAAKLAASAATTAANRAAGTRAAQQTLGSCLAKVAKVLEDSAPIMRMADIAAGTSGDNAKRLTLQTFVLLKRFEDVIVMANERLSGISDGRYELERSDEKEAGGGNRLGLALKVIDRDLDEPRDPKTLSGGETFYVSLCLALGLADVVTAETGGVELGTLFIDEGFGTLDPETLESVLQVLATLRSGGRTVGVVSHVEALKQTILDGISVRHLPAGGSTMTVRG